MTQLLVAVSLLLVLALLMGLLAQRFGQPVILGELVAGLVLGPTVFGRLFPEASLAIFPNTGLIPSFFSGFGTIASALLLFIAGIETRRSSLTSVRNTAFVVSLSGVVVPFALGLAAVALFRSTFQPPAGGTRWIFGLFVATAMSISALPVIAKTLLDLRLLEGRIGQITMAAAIADDFAGWTIFAAVLGLAAGGRSLVSILVLTTGFLVVALYWLPRVADLALRWMNRSGDRSVSAALLLTLVCAALTEWIGIHALFGAFIAGIALSDSRELSTAARHGIRSLVLSFFAPLFIAGIALKADFIRFFDLKLVAIVLVIASVGKIVGCGLVGYISGLSAREACGVGICMNSRGAMEIILGSVALEKGLIGPELFVALVAMALITSAAVGPLLKLLDLTPRFSEIPDHSRPNVRYDASMEATE